MGRLVFGIQPVREAVRVHGAALEKVFLETGHSARRLGLERFAAECGAVVERVQRRELDRLAHGGRHQGAAALAPELRLRTLDEIELGARGVVVALDSVTDPQNFGAAIRNAVGWTDAAVLWGEHGAAPLTPAVSRASAGAVEHARLCRVRSLRAALEELKRGGATVLALEPSASVTLAEVDLRGPVVLVAGAEDKGLSRGVRLACSQRVRLPMQGPLGSLNVSATLTAALYELVRQRLDPVGQLGDAKPK